ncbi:(2Fe-2S)-binding protein [Amantichitinum ursilacus]|uniref:(2Fe-2S)-binding protein n=1 Tax=Amantichitinum ursilacus TaxID=857265 RepID=UPI001F1972DD|nr:(2Fe-2S)-binding protein [Amantichitinum ursilacus]
MQQLVDAQPWQGPRIKVFNSLAGTVPDRVVCNCKQVKESAIRARVTQGDGLDTLKAKLGCGTVCGSCVPEIKRMCASVALV